MTIRAKTKRRLILLLVAMVLICGLGAGGYVLRMRKLRQADLDRRAEGVRAFHDDQFAQSVSLLGPYLQKHPDDAKALFAYAQARLRVEDSGGRHVAETKRALRHVLTMKPDWVDAARILLELYARDGQHSEVLKTADRVLAGAPDDLTALRLKAVALAQLRSYDEALEVVRRHNELVPLDLEGQMLTLSILRQAQQPGEQIVAHVDALRQTHPDQAPLLLLQGVAYRLARDDDSARQWLQRAAEHAADVSDPLFLKTLVAQLDATALHDEALAVLQRVADQTGEVRIVQSLVRRLWETGKVEEIDKRLAAGPAPQQLDSELVAMHALALIRLQRSDEADRLTRILAQRDDDATAAAWAVLLHQMRQTATSDPLAVVTACDRALAESPDNPILRYFVGRAYLAMGEQELALVAWRGSAAQAPRWSGPLISMAQALADAGRIVPALQVAYEAVRRSPRNVGAQMTYARLWAAWIERATGDTSTQQRQLLKLLADLHERVPLEPSTLPVRVVLMAQNGQRDEARALVEQALTDGDDLGQEDLLRLASACRRSEIDLDEQCLKRVEELHGLSPRLVSIQAEHLHAQGRPDEGLELFKSAMSQEDLDAPARREFRIQWARYLDRIGDARAANVWIKLADQMPKDHRVQRLALAAAAVQSDRAFRDRTIDRLQQLTGPRSVGWRLARARWLLESPELQRDAAKAIVLLNDVIREAPALVEPRLLLAGALQQMNNTDGAIEQLTVAAGLQPDSVDIALRLAVILQSENRFDAALAHLQPVVDSIYLTDRQRRQAARLLAGQDRIKQAIGLLEDAHEQSTDPSPDDLLLAGLYRRAGRPDRALQICERRLTSQPDLPTIAMAAQLLDELGRPEQALEMLGRLDALPDQAWQQTLAKAQFHQRRGELDEALAQYRAASEQAPEAAEPWQGMVTLHLLQGQVDEALTVVDQALVARDQDEVFRQLHTNAQLVQTVGAQPSAVQILAAAVTGDEAERAAAYQVMKILAEAGDAAPTQSVIVRLRSISDSHPRFLALQLLMLRMHVQLEQWADAARLGMRTIEASPAAEPAAMATAALTKLERWDEALTAARQWRRRALQRSRHADMAIAQIQLKLRDPDDALRHLQPHLDAALADESDADADLIHLYAWALVSTDDVDEAEELLGARLARGPGWRTIWRTLATHAIGRDEDAARWLDGVQAYIPDDGQDELIDQAVAWLKLSERFGQQSYRDRAREIFDRLEQYPNATVEALINVGIMAEADGQVERAEAAYRRALDINPDAAVANNNLAMVILRADGDIDEALELARKAAELAPQSANFADTLAQVQMAHKQYADAAAELTRAVELDPDQPKWRVKLAEVFVASGQWDEAGRALDQIDRLPAAADMPQALSRRIEDLRRTIEARAQAQ